MEGRRKITLVRGNCISKVREIGINVTCVTFSEKQWENQTEQNRKDLIKNRRKLSCVGKVEHQITEDLQSQKDKFGLKYSSKHRAVKCL